MSGNWNLRDKRGTTAESPPSTFDLREFSRLLYKRRWLLTAIVAVALAGAVVLTLRQTKMYRARASIIIDPKPPEILGSDIQEVVQLGAGQMWWNQEYYNTQLNILTSRSLATMTVESHALAEDPRVVGAQNLERPEDQRLTIATRAVRRWLTVKPHSDQNRTFYIVFETPVPELSAQLANAHVNSYIDYSRGRRTTVTGEASSHLAVELDTAYRDLRTAQQELASFKAENGLLIGSLEDQKALPASNIKRYSEALSDARKKRIALGAMRKQLRAASKTSVLESAVFEITESDTGKKLREEYYAAMRELSQLATEIGPKNPNYIKQKQTVDQLLAALETEAARATAGVNQAYRVALDTETDYQREITSAAAAAGTFDKLAAEYDKRTGHVRDKQKGYNRLQDRLGASSLTGRLKTVNIRMLDRALVPTAPSSPRMDLNLALATILALLFGIGLATLLEYLDRTVKNGKDAEAALGAPLLGIIPIVEDVKNSDPYKRDLHVHLEPTSRAAECCRSIRTNLLFMSADGAFRTLVVASPNPREGKSMSVLYLGTIMAQSGQRVLLIDSDLRRPRLHQSLNVSRAQGLSNLVMGDVTPEEVIKETEIPNLFILPAGPTPPNPAELLMTDRFAAVMKTLGGMFDRILLDSPPILAVTDALVLTRHADGVILVAKAGDTTREDVSRSARHLADVDAHVVGGVLNQLDLDRNSYGYYHYYYSYGRDEEEQANHA